LRHTFHLDRREFVTGAAAIAASSSLSVASASDTHAALFVCDRHCAGQLRGAHHNGNILWFNGDVTPIWWNTLRPLWRSEQTRVIGVTRAPALFCLEQLAHRDRHRVIARQTLRGSDAIGWIIASVSSGVLT
jgi:hypothetical protein